MTTIEWTDRTWNPIRGCSRVSEGCRHCYAEAIAARFSQQGNTFHGFAERTPDGPRWTGAVTLLPDRLREPLAWKKPARIFVNSMSDLFHEGLTDDAIDRVFAVMAWTPWHTYQVLTKRAERMREYFAGPWHERVGLRYRELREKGIASLARDPQRQFDQGFSFGAITCGDPDRRALPNVWLGVSVENQHLADERIPLLLQTPAAVRFISGEPLLGPVNLSHYLNGREEHGTPFSDPPARTVGGCIGWTPALDWVIVGGESGPGARPFDLAWARSILRQCRAAGVACFVKQLGADPREANPGGRRHSIDALVKSWRLILRDKKGGDIAEWPDDLRVREFPA